ncbi:DNA/RNA polymerases superfamily protein [Gossypium australe]|uniref:DNA/RNA polymerases superfamily protein n=1 Tax=Gossypium australe TaxID=47621 RepID=A0A5B6UUT3_9ROSI|nr:DNA/RNA polymerases superfamily protein [Gossypium australe]
MTPEWKWDRVTMDFMSGLPLSPKKKDAIWVVIDRLMKSTHFILVRIDYSLERLAELLHGVPVSIISYRDSRFTSRLWKKLQEALAMKLNFSTAFRPQTDGQSERIIQILKDMLRSCVLEFKGNWEKYLPQVEFAYINSFQSSIKMEPYEALYGRKCLTPLETEEKVKVIHDCLKTASDRQKSYADLNRKDIEFQIVTKCKLSPRFIGPYEIIERIGPVAYRLALPLVLEKIYNIKELRNKHIALVKVLWQRHGVEEATWEPEEAIRKQYPNLFTDLGSTHSYICMTLVSSMSMPVESIEFVIKVSNPLGKSVLVDKI